MDFNQYLGIQHAAVAALEGAEADMRRAAKTFQARRDALVEALGVAGWTVPLPQAGEGYVRFALVRPPEVLTRAAARLQEFAEVGA